MNKEIIKLHDKIQELEGMIPAVKNCPVCEHKTAMTGHIDVATMSPNTVYFGASFSSWYGDLDYPAKVFDCLTCGKQIKFTTKEIGTEVK